MPPIARLLTTPEALDSRVAALATEIREQEPGDLLLVTMLKGGVPFLADLVRALPVGVEVDFLRLSPYPGGEHPPGSARIEKDLDQPVTGRHVLIVEDIVDTGLSLSFLFRNLSDRQPASMKICTLLDRAAKRLVDLPIAYRGFGLGREYVVGYGLDFHGMYRNLPCLVAVNDLDALHADPLALDPLLREWGIWGT